MVEHARRHTDEKPLVCRECGKTFRQLATLIRHKKKHTRERLKNAEQSGAVSKEQPDRGCISGGDLKTVPVGHSQNQVEGEVYGKSE
ncbi:MAG TPA: hypothetical protein DCW74_19005 [Alteromonas australica]|uniref:C2H2-type domain-containing protein n=1 Tax=Alteromonas australica TaxID=589873 RepID=A0A350P943_9ALTE|nr:hypothetical protein [Alteromonas australica]